MFVVHLLDVNDQILKSHHFTPRNLQIRAWMKAWKRNRSRKSPSEPSTWQLHCHTLGFVVSPSCSERALICFSVINKPVVIFRWLSMGFPPHVWRQTHEGCIYSPGRYCDPPDIRGQIILLLHLGSCETLDKLSRSWKATRVSDRVQAECQQRTGRARPQRKVSLLLPPGLTSLWTP